MKLLKPKESHVHGDEPYAFFSLASYGEFCSQIYTSTQGHTEA
jgi:hypothetical protein